MAHNLAQVLFAPKSVAIVGQSNDAGKTAGRPLKYLRQAGFAGRMTVGDDEMTWYLERED